MSNGLGFDDPAHADLAAEFSKEEFRLWFAYFDMEAALWQRLTKQLRRDTGLSEADFRVLVSLLNAEPEQLRSYELAARIDFDRARLHRHLDRMETRGMIRRRQADDNPRGVVVELAPDGRAAIVAARPVRSRHIREAIVQALTPEELAAFTHASEKILANLRSLER
ncbi:MarR family winged helix-turn-helix transcriptional regulator [Dactylosporangium cerinum]|uniref:MarR family winged helix-turn-helix transcriptional regulator n=1 Tax=Dactylosporangium cerinum TaxID=1434730 RepID=A0ABV9W295_9ACTN